MSVATEEGEAGQQQDGRAGSSAAFRRAPLLCLASTAALAAAVHLFVIFQTPIVRTLGDEASYTREAHRHIDDGPAQLLPGRMLFHHRPPFAFHFFALFAERDLITHPEEELWIIDTPHESWSPAMARFVRSVSLAHLLLLLGTGVALYAIAARLGAGPVGANVAAALVLLNPRVGFYVQSLWTEILHMALLAGGMLLVLSAIDRRRPLPDAGALLRLAVAGVVLGYAVLTRGVVGSFSWILAALLVAQPLFDAWRRREPRSRSLAWGVAHGAVFLLALHGTLLPQRLANLEQHGTALVAHNTWRNIEAGVARRADYAERYKAASDDPEEREALARARVLEHLRTTPKLPLLSRQTEKFVTRISRSYIDRGSTRERWGAGVSPTLAAGAATAFSWVVFVLGIAGMALRGASSAGALILSAFTLYYMAGLMVVIGNVRMFLQLVPPLAVFAGLLVGTLWQRRLASARGLSRRREPSPPRPAA